MVPEINSRSPQNCRILVIGSDPGSRETLLEPLRWEMWDARGVSSSEEAEALFDSWRPQIVLLDANPDPQGAAWVTNIRGRLPHASVLFISDDSGTDAIITGLDQGADDYIIKPFVPLELLARIRTHLRIRDLHEQLVIANEKLKELVDIDDLTGLYNMRSLYQRLEFEIERGRRFGRDVCVVMMDMDNFKSVNDGHDHLFGSYVLSEIGKIIKANTRNIDIPARYGGDEFLVVLTEVNEEGARLFCERLRKAIAKNTFVSGEDSINLTVSLGFALVQPGEVLSSKELVRRADHALYEAKRTGRDRVCTFVPNNNVHALPVKKIADPASLRRPKKASGG
ncbi:MAG: diguanylate cyclase [Bdellovibrionaceae bacterium]|nr:diguanylate cyclase [Pseudobdellovibrionaceae bacterium]MBX3032667.1 diguanylate cyclase [Pseudobdellovibrionaceae bacterium]